MTRLFVLMCCFVFVFICCSCWGDGHFDGSGHLVLLQNSSKHKNPVACKIEGGRVFVLGDDVNIPIIPFYIQCFSRVFLNAPNKYYRVYHFILEKDVGEKIFLSYKFPLTMGVGAIKENSDFVIIEKDDAIKIYYNREPVGGFIVEHNPFSKKILIEYSETLFYLKTVDGACFYNR